MKFDYTPDEQREAMAQNLPSIQQKVDETVLAWGIYYRSGSWGALAARQVSPLAGTVISLIGKKRAAGLPQHFILAVTPTKIHAFAYRPVGTRIRVGDEVAVWDRSAVRLSAEETELTMRLTIESPADAAKVVCDTGKAAITDDFLRAAGATVEPSPLLAEL